jgi:hypothetical protein
MEKSSNTNRYKKKIYPIIMVNYTDKITLCRKFNVTYPTVKKALDGTFCTSKMPNMQQALNIRGYAINMLGAKEIMFVKT